MYVLPWHFDQGILPHKTGQVHIQSAVNCLYFLAVF